MTPQKSEIHEKLNSLLEETSQKGPLEFHAVLHMLVATSLSGDLLEFARHCVEFGDVRLTSTGRIR